jgi:hypothetical protein
MLTRETILASLSQPGETIAVNVPEWGGTVNIRLLSETEIETFGTDTKHARSRFAAMACCDGDGKRLFTDADVSALSAAPGGFTVLDRIWNEGGKFNGLLDKEPEKN